MYALPRFFARARLASLLGLALLATCNTASAETSSINLIFQAEPNEICQIQAPVESQLYRRLPPLAALAAEQVHLEATTLEVHVAEQVAKTATQEPPATKPAPLGGTFEFIAKLPSNMAASTASLSSHIASKFRIDPAVSEKVVHTSLEVGKNLRIPPTLILAIIAVESSFKPSAKNGNATGLMQIIPYWHKEKVTAIGGPKELFKVEKNIATGTQILRELIDRSKGNLFNAIYRYNASPTADAYAKKVLREQSRFEQVLQTSPPPPKME